MSATRRTGLVSNLPVSLGRGAATVLASLLLASLLLANQGASPKSVTVEDLVYAAEMNPNRLAQAVSNFAYEFHAQLQPPEVFLEKRAGDCDDFAVLADVVLKQHQFHTRLIHVRMAGGISHAVCYVQESRAYLDYNNRRYFFKLTGSKPRLREIAEKVAASFEGNWTTVSEFTYDAASEQKAILYTVVKTESPERDPDHGNQ